MCWHANLLLSYVPRTVEKPGLLLIIILLSFALPQSEVFAQKENENVLLHPDKFYRKFFPNLKVKRDPPDSLYIRLYPNYLSTGLHILSPSIGTTISSRSSKANGVDASSKFKTNIFDIVGVSVSYRFVTAGFAFVTKSGMNMHDNYIPSRYRTLTIKYNRGPYVLQFKYLRIKGFTDINQSNNNDPASVYVIRPDVTNREYQFEGIYNFNWRKYSYVAPLNFSQRQVKSHWGILLKAGVYYNQFSGDSSLISSRQMQYFDDFDDITELRSLSVRIAPGLGGTLVIARRFYLSATAFTSFDLFFYKYLKLPDEKTSGNQAFTLVIDGKVSLGYQSKRLYAGVRYEAERRNGALKNIGVNATYNYTGIELGYRFDAPKVVKKVYKKTMPPGM